MSKYEYKNSFIIKSDNIYRRNGLLIAKVVKLYKCVECPHICNTLEEADNHYKQFHQNCISSAAYHRNYGKTKNILTTNQISDQNKELNEWKTFEEMNCGKRIKTYGKTNTQNETKSGFVEEVVETSEQRFKDRERMVYECEYCELSFLEKRLLSLHTNVHLFPKICDYPYCEEKFAMDYERQGHYRRCHENTGSTQQLIYKYRCDICQKYYSTQAEARLHSKLHTDPQVCDFPNCGKTFSCQSILRKHFQIHDKSQSFECDICHRIFPLLVRLNTHKKLHTNPIVCQFNNCGKVFASNCYLKIHSLTHLKYKPYSCKWPGCQFITKHSQSLISHQKTHSNDRPHTCQWTRCTQAFKTSASLRRHIECKHKKERSFSCEWSNCDKSFSYKETLNSHYRTHTGERPFVCVEPECFKTFAHRDGLQRHKCKHRGEKPQMKTLDKQISPQNNYESQFRRLITTIEEIIVPNSDND